MVCCIHNGTQIGRISALGYTVLELAHLVQQVLAVWEILLVHVVYFLFGAVSWAGGESRVSISSSWTKGKPGGGKNLKV